MTEHLESTKSTEGFHWRDGSPCMCSVLTNCKSAPTWEMTEPSLQEWDFPHGLIQKGEGDGCGCSGKLNIILDIRRIRCYILIWSEWKFNIYYDSGGYVGQPRRGKHRPRLRRCRLGRRRPRQRLRSSAGRYVQFETVSNTTEVSFILRKHN